jgi:hypothetical protein
VEHAVTSTVAQPITGDSAPGPSYLPPSRRIAKTINGLRHALEASRETYGTRQLVIPQHGMVEVWKRFGKQCGSGFVCRGFTT